MPHESDEADFREVVRGLIAGDFSRLEPEFLARPDGGPSRIVAWCQAGRFDDQPDALAEAFTCACFLGRVDEAERLLGRGAELAGGSRTGLNAMHWAVNRGQAGSVELLLRHGPDLEVRNVYGGTALGTAVWSAIHEPREAHRAIIERLLEAGARVEEAEYPSGDEPIDAILRRYGAR